MAVPDQQWRDSSLIARERRGRDGPGWIQRDEAT